MAVVYVLMYFICKICFTVYTGETKNDTYYVSFIMLTNVKMSTTILKCQLLLLAFKHLRDDKFHAQVS